MEEATAWVTAEAEVTERDLERAWAEVTAGDGAATWVTAGAGTATWATAGAVAAEDKDAARDTDTGRECVHGIGVPRPGPLSITAGGDNQDFAAAMSIAASATLIPSCTAVAMPNSSLVMSSL